MLHRWLSPPSCDGLPCYVLQAPVPFFIPISVAVLLSITYVVALYDYNAYTHYSPMDMMRQRSSLLRGT
jgi:hypothetical protein